MSAGSNEQFNADFRALMAAYEAGGHSVFRPSSASRWMVCAGSIFAEIEAARDSAGFAAAEGTVAHAIAEHTLKHSKRPTWAKPGKVREERGFAVPISVEMIGYVEEYIDWIKALGPADVTATETRIDFSDLTPIPSQGGTADHTHIANRVLTISDLKYGAGVRVYAKRNKAMLLYAYGVWREWAWAYQIDRIVVRICQPRLEVFDTWEITVEELMEFAAEAKAAAHRAWTPNAPRTPEPNACRFCSAQGTCPALVAQAEALADELFDDLDGREIQPETVSVPNAVIAPRSNPKVLATDELAVVLRWRGTFDSFFRSVHDELMERMDGGQTADGWKIVEGTTNRAWISEESVAATLLAMGLTEDEIYTRKIVSPKRASDLLRVKKLKPDLLLKPHVAKPPGKRALVTEHDSRPDVESAGDDLLDDLS